MTDQAVSGTAPPADPLQTLREAPMGKAQWLIVFLCISLMALDGYDVLSISFAAPGLAEEWGLGKAVLGIILPLELLGMALGATLMGSLADAKGRRPVMLICLTVLSIGMAVAGAAPNIYVLGAARVFTGIGIGGLMAALTAICSEYANDKNRSLTVVLMAGGFPLGVYLGATFLGPLLKEYDWRVTFYLGAFISLIFIPLVYFIAPETVSYLSRKRPKNALERIGIIMKRLGHQPPETLPPVPASTVAHSSPKALFKPGLAAITIFLMIAYFGNIATYYYFVKWLPTLVTDLGYSKSDATSVLGVISLGGVVGSISMGLILRFVKIKPLIIVCLLIAALGVALFPSFTQSVLNMKMAGFVTGATLFAAISGFFGLFATSFPSSLLGSGTGLVLGFGRGGAVLGPMIPGFLFAAGLALQNVALMMAAGSFTAAIVVLFMPKKPMAG